MIVVDVSQNQAEANTNMPYRVFSTTGQWYFALPQGGHCGPYASQLQADIEAGLLWQQLLREPAQAKAVIEQFCRESAVEFTQERLVESG